MSWESIPPIEREKLLALHRSKDFTSIDWEADRREMNRATLRRRLQEMNKTTVNPNDDRPTFENYLRITTNDMVFISDIEIPDHHEELMEYAQQVGKIYEIDDCMWAGDVDAADQYSKYPVHWKGDHGVFDANISTTRKLFTKFCGTYKRQTFIQGNHDARFAYANGGNVWFGSLFDIPNFTFSRYSYCYIQSNRGLIMVAHPNRKFAENAIDLGRRIINQEKIPCHLVLAHTHQGIRGWSKNGVHEIIALGCMRDPIKTMYKQIDKNTYGEWQPGFAMMKNGYFYQLNLFSTDWKSVLKGNLIA